MTEANVFRAQALDLQQRHLIEASAGTGKTFSIATLYVRALIEKRLSPTQILVVTFSRAATSELRERLRERVALAAQRAAERAQGRDETDIDATLRDFIDASLDAAIAAEESAMSPSVALDALSQHLRICAHAMDEAAIFTIHGFCQRLLVDYPSDFGVFEQAELVENQAELFDQAVADVQRQTAHETEAAALIKDARSAADTLINLGTPLAGAQDAAALLHAFVARLRAQRTLLERCLGVDKAFKRTGRFVTRGMPLILLRLAQTETEQDLLAAVEELPELVGNAKLREELGPDLLGLCSDPASLFINAQRPSDDDLAALSSLCDGLDMRAALQGLDIAITPPRLLELVLAIVERLRTIKQRARLISFDELISTVAGRLREQETTDLQAKLAERFSLVMVDEFQDTDAGQFTVFDGLFPREGRTGMIFIGDPKQAIYGFRGGDVAAYLAAGQTAQQHWTLNTNYRSTPALIGALNDLYAPLSDAENALLGTGIHYEHIEAGKSERHLQLADGVAPPLRIVASAEDEIDEAQRIAASVRECLDGRLPKDGKEVPVSPGDIAVLCKSHTQIADVRKALAALNIPSATRKGASVYLAVEAQEMLILLRTLLAPRDERHLRTLLAGPLFGYSIAELDAELADTGKLEQWLESVLDWRQTAQRFGLVAVVIQLLRRQLPTLRHYADYERRVRNWQHLAELTQASFLARHSLQDVARELQEQIQRARTGDDAGSEAELRLETDQAAVQLLTLHSAKGLQFPIVMLAPMAPSKFAPKVLRLPPDANGHARAVLQPAKALIQQTTEAELQRLLYVGLTRAEVCCQVFWKEDVTSKGVHKDPFSKLLRCHGDDMNAALAKLRASQGIEVLPSSCFDDEPPSFKVTANQSLEYRIPDDPAWRMPWFLTSFTGLVRGVQREEQAVVAGQSAEDEAGARHTLVQGASSDVLSRYRGAQLGQVLHDLLEAKTFERWLGEDTEALNTMIDEACRHNGLVPNESDRRALRQAIRDLLARSVRTPFIGAADLCSLEHSSLAEMEFMLALNHAQLDDFSARLARAGIADGRLDLTKAGQRQWLNGMLNGYIDLLARVDGRWFVIDYKGNDLGPEPRDYAPAALHEAMLDHYYDLQATLYLLALHRHLRRTLPDYAPGEHLGGVRYLFLRGLDGSAQSPGIYSAAPDIELILDLDALIAGQEVAA